MAAQHTDPDDAIQIMLDLEAKAAVGMHWGTFKLTDEPWDEPARRLTAGLRGHGINAEKFIAMRPAETAEFEWPDAGSRVHRRPFAAARQLGPVYHLLTVRLESCDSGSTSRDGLGTQNYIIPSLKESR